MSPQPDFEAQLAEVRSLAESAARPRSWFVRILRACSAERQKSERITLHAILQLTAQLVEESKARNELVAQHAQTEGNLRGLFAGLQGALTSIEDVSQAVRTLRTDLERELPDLGRRLLNLHTDLRTIERAASNQAETLAIARSDLIDLAKLVSTSNEALRENINHDVAAVGNRLAKLEGTVSNHHAEWSTRSSALQAELVQIGEYSRSVRAQATALADELQQFIAEKAQARISAEESGGMPQLFTRMMDLETTAAALRSGLAGVATSALEQEAKFIEQNRQRSLFERFYLAFENRYRGSTSEIRDRQKAVLPFVEQVEALKSISRKDAVVIDIGCGRGEWLDVLRAAGFERAVGIDTSGEMINECRKRSLSVELADAQAYLERQADHSVVAITGFHIVEHLPFPAALELMTEARRVLIRTGVLIFETPNPENALVATRTFHLDPTHRAPLPPLLLAFAIEHAGFDPVQVARLHPYPPDHQVKGQSKITTRFNDYFYCAQDYLVAGYNK